MVIYYTEYTKKPEYGIRETYMAMNMLAKLRVEALVLDLFQQKDSYNFFVAMALKNK